MVLPRLCEDEAVVVVLQTVRELELALLAFVLAQERKGFPGQVQRARLPRLRRAEDRLLRTAGQKLTFDTEGAAREIENRAQGDGS
jgi:hypothetical protein